MPAGDTAIVVVVVEQFPTLMLLTCDLGGTGLALCVERVEVLFQSVFRALAGIDGAADTTHQVSPKNRGPDQWAPVIRLATADSEG